MAEETTSRGSGKNKQQPEFALVMMHDVHCERLEFDFRVALDKFNLDGMIQALGAKDPKRTFATANTRDPERSDYHAHFEWRVRKKQAEIRLDITYIASPVKPEPDEKEPFADNLMQWVGQFFRHPDANARIHSDFEFDTKSTVQSWFPLPLRTKVVDVGEGSIDGISVALPSQPNGVARFFLSNIKDSIFVTIESERRIKFADFALATELQVERAFVNKMIEVKT